MFKMVTSAYFFKKGVHGIIIHSNPPGVIDLSSAYIGYQMITSLLISIQQVHRIIIKNTHQERMTCIKYIYS